MLPCLRLSQVPSAAQEGGQAGVNGAGKGPKEGLVSARVISVVLDAPLHQLVGLLLSIEVGRRFSLMEHARGLMGWRVEIDYVLWVPCSSYST